MQCRPARRECALARVTGGVVGRDAALPDGQEVEVVRVAGATGAAAGRGRGDRCRGRLSEFLLGAVEPDGRGDGAQSSPHLAARHDAVLQW